MQLVEYSSNKSEEMVALDEVLLAKAEAGELGETLRLWSAQESFIVVGRAGRVAEDCFLNKCRQDNIKIIRRISGGGTVLQGAGCLNYSLVLSFTHDQKCRDIKYSYRRILGDISRAFKSKGLGIEFFPTSDLALDGRKVSGNAQARKRKYFLHHGTFLFDFDLEKVSYYLRHPGRQPEYRKGRVHEDFLANIPVSREELRELIKDTFSFSGDVWEPGEGDLEALNDLVSSKYESDNWNLAF